MRFSTLLHDRANSKQKIFDNCLGGYAKDPSVYPIPGATGPKAVKAMDVATERPAYYETIMTQDWFQLRHRALAPGDGGG